MTKSLIKRVANSAEDSWKSGKEKFEEVQDSTESFIKKNPLKSVAIAAGVGALIGAGIVFLISSSKKSWWEKHNPFE